MYFLAKSDFKATVADMKNLDRINDFIKNKDIVPMFDMYEVDAANTDAEVYETGNFLAETKKASKGMTFEHYLGFSSHSALKSYEDSEYTKYIEVTDEGYLIGVYHSDKEHMTGESIKSFEVGMRMKATSSKPPYSTVTIKFEDSKELEDYAIQIKPNYNPNIDVKGMMEVVATPISYEGVYLTYDMVYKSSGTSIRSSDLDVCLVVSINANIGSPEAPKVSHNTLISEALPNGTWRQKLDNGSYAPFVDRHFFWLVPAETNIPSSKDNIGASILFNGRILKFSEKEFTIPLSIVS